MLPARYTQGVCEASQTPACRRMLTSREGRRVGARAPELGLPALGGEGLVHAAVLGGVGAPARLPLGLAHLAGLGARAVPVVRPAQAAVGQHAVPRGAAVPVRLHAAPVGHVRAQHLHARSAGMLQLAIH